MNYQPNGLLEKCWTQGRVQPFGVKQDLPAFDITEIAKFCYVGKASPSMDMTSAKFCIPPFEKCWMEYELTRGVRRSLVSGWGNTWETERDGERHGFLITQVAFDDWSPREGSVKGVGSTAWLNVKKALVDLRNLTHPPAIAIKWVLEVESFRGMGNFVSPAFPNYFLLTETGDIVELEGDVAGEADWVAAHWAHWPVLMAISFLNCPKQVTFIERKSPPRVIKDGRAKSPEITYKTLVVGAVRRILEAYQRGDHQLALHLCRGCFKTFTEDRKLFGKYVGRWWWEPQVRGDIANGEVRKNYKTVLTTAS